MILDNIVLFRFFKFSIDPSLDYDKMNIFTSRAVEMLCGPEIAFLSPAFTSRTYTEPNYRKERALK